MKVNKYKDKERRMIPFNIVENYNRNNKKTVWGSRGEEKMNETSREKINRGGGVGFILHFYWRISRWNLK